MKRRRKGLCSVAAGLLLLTACQPPVSVPVETIEEDDLAALAPTIQVADPNASLQLVKGFHAVEQDAWRWTMQRFAVTLAPPAGSAGQGALLRLQFAIPETITERLGPIMLSATVGATPLEPETYSAPGSYAYERAVPPEALAGDAVTVEFALDKALPPGDLDQRELGVVVSAVGFELQ